MYMVTSPIDNVQVTASRRGMQFINNCYLNRLTSVRVIGHENTYFGLGIGPQSGVLTMTDISLTGSHFPLYMDTSSAVIDGLWIEMTSGTEIGAVFKGWINATALVNDPIISAETGPSTIRYAVAEVGIGSLVMNSGVIETYNHAPHVGIFGDGSVVHTAPNYSGMAPTSIFQIVTPPMYPVQLISPIQQNITVPWADSLSWIQTAPVKTNQSCTGSDKVSGISSTGTLVCSPDQGPQAMYSR
jgi:hypothetical protein